ncbi:Pentatricopeptide repeat [Dillenia turbinata]|uniref:Pentatricopeptide repeat n=1 Tax=Dillenia turbinata TaxID=194707 RepID=A0AAN8VQT0_9MAGN
MGDSSLCPNVVVYMALIDGLCKNNCIEEANRLFHEMQQKCILMDRTAYTSLIDGNLKHGNLQGALDLRNRMFEIGKGVPPDDVVYGVLIRKYYELGKVDEALEMQN